jgi:hypothetical protein
MKDQNHCPKCPKCGEPARRVIGTALVEVRIEADGTAGRVLRAWRFQPGAKYVCGGGHRWELGHIPISNEADDKETQ